MATVEDADERGDDREGSAGAEDSGPAAASSVGPAQGDRTGSGVEDDRIGSGADGDRYTRRDCVLITGCSSGIGRATAAAFLEEGWTVVATARNADDVTDLDEAGCETMALDVTDPEQVADAVERTVELGGAIDCLVNNAGYAQMGPLEDVPLADLHRQFDVNVYGPHRLTRAALPHMRAQGEGTIVNLSSVMGRISFAGSGAYAGSKHALEAMTDALRHEASEFDVDVVLVEPGPVDTAFDERVESEMPDQRTGDYAELYEIYEDAELVGGGGPLAVEPEAVAAAVVDASTRSDPPARYPVGPVAKYGLYASHLPDSLRDAVYRLVRRLV